MRRLRLALLGALLLTAPATLALPELVATPRPPAQAAPTPPQGRRIPPAAGHTRPASHPRSRPLAPHTARVLLVVEENHEFGQVIGARSAPFLNQLARRGTLLTRYYATTHPSLPNYLALLTGATDGIGTDCRACQVRATDLVDQLQAAGISWKAYYQGLPAPCSTISRAGFYSSSANPFVHLDDVRSALGRCHRVVPLARLPADLASGRLPRFALVWPDLRHDMHNGYGTIAAGDAFLHRLYRQLVASPAWEGDTRLVVTFDEGTSDRGIGGRRGGGRVATIVVGPRVPAGVRDRRPYDHYALLRSIERLFGLPPLRHAADPTTATIRALS